MTDPKPRKKSYSTLDMRTPLCLKQVACDGVNLAPSARERGYCARCKVAMERRAARGNK
jgi:hypothetical protein